LVESGMNPKAISKAGAQGLMQLMPQTAIELKVTDPFDPSQAIYGGAKYLSRQLRSFGRDDYALAAYNAGPGAVKRAGGIPNYTETQRYVKKVMRYYDHFRQRRPVQQKR
jgi:soluble lytic murein transglycosylase-like protein